MLILVAEGGTIKKETNCKSDRSDAIDEENVHLLYRLTHRQRNIHTNNNRERLVLSLK